MMVFVVVVGTRYGESLGEIDGLVISYCVPLPFRIHLLKRA